MLMMIYMTFTVNTKEDNNHKVMLIVTIKNGVMMKIIIRKRARIRRIFTTDVT